MNTNTDTEHTQKIHTNTDTDIDTHRKIHTNTGTGTDRHAQENTHKHRHRDAQEIYKTQAQIRTGKYTQTQIQTQNTHRKIHTNTGTEHLQENTHKHRHRTPIGKYTQTQAQTQTDTHRKIHTNTDIGTDTHTHIDMFEFFDRFILSPVEDHLW